MRCAAAVLTMLALAGCDAPTELVLVIDSDLAPARFDRIVATHRRAADEPATSVANVDADSPLPRTLVLRHEGGSLGPIAVDVIAQLGDGPPIVERGLELTFVSGRSIRVPVRLDASCEGVVCEAGATCAAGDCRPRRVEPCELLGERCEADAGPSDGGQPDAEGPDAEPSDAGPDGGPPIDAGPTCPLDLGICDVPAIVARGERLRPVACAGGDAALVWTLSRGATPGPTETGAAPELPVTEPGAHTVRAEWPTDETCFAEVTLRTAQASVVDVGSIGSAFRDLDARPGLAFLATGGGPFAVNAAGALLDLDQGATGPLTSTNLHSVAVVGRDAYFGADDDQDALTRATTDDAGTDVTFTAVPLPTVADPGARRDTRAMAVVANRDTPELLVATVGGLVYYADVAAAGVGLTPFFDANREVGLAVQASPELGPAWGVRGRHYTNLEISPPSAVIMSERNSDAAPDFRAMLVDDRDPAHQRLWLCGENADNGGIEIYDLADPAWAGATDLITPLRVVPTVCSSMATDDRGDVWVGGEGGLQRYDRDGELLAVYGAEDLAATAWVIRVAAAWDATTREVWFLAADGPGEDGTALYRLESTR